MLTLFPGKQEMARQDPCLNQQNAFIVQMIECSYMNIIKLMQG